MGINKRLIFLLLVGISASSRVAAGSDPVTERKVDALTAAARQIYLEDADSARAIAIKALLLAKKSDYRLGIGRSFKEIGGSYWAQAYYPVSLFYLNTSLPYLLGRPTELADAYRAIGRCQVEVGKTDLGLQTLKTAERYAGSDPATRCNVLSDIVYAYRKAHQYPPALRTAQTALKLADSIGNGRFKAILKSHIALILADKGQYREALLLLDSTAKLAVQFKNNRLRTICEVNRSLMNYRLKHYEAAVGQALLGYQMAQTLGSLAMVAKAGQYASSAYQALGDNKNALIWSKRVAELKDSINEANIARSVKVIQDYFLLSEKLHTMEHADEDGKAAQKLVASQRTVIITLSISICLLVIMVLVIYSNYKHKKTRNSQLQAHNALLSEQKKIIEDQSRHLAELNTAKDKILGVIGHDLRTPVANLRSVVELYNGNYLSQDELKAIMKEVIPALNGAEMTLSNLMTWASSQQRGLVLHPERIRSKDLANTMFQIFEHPLGLKKIKLVLHTEDTHHLLADPNHLNTILHNLLSNAIKFTPVNGTITLRITAHGERVEVAVEDTGMGISPDKIHQLFKYNQHFTSVGTNGERGTGLGLLLCYELVMLNGGKIWVKSELGKGSRFVFSLPAEPIPQPQEPA